jgi:alpha-1,2-glucosyltransferase
MGRNKYFIYIPIIFAINLIIANRFNKNLTGPYMDEEFHFDQVVHYIQGDYTYWNSKLTTFPGLFIISSLLYSIFQSIIVIDGFSFLRIINSQYGVGLAWVVGKFDEMNSQENNFIFQLIVTLLPINYFFNFLFYTDGLSTFLVMLYLGVGGWSKGSRFIVFLC